VIDAILLIFLTFMLWNLLAAVVLYSAKLREESKQDIINCKWSKDNDY